MSEVASSFVSIMPSMKGFGSQVVKEATVAGETAGATSGRRFGDFFTKSTIGPLRAFGEAAAGIFAGEKIFEFLKGSVEVAREAQQLQQEVAQAIKSTGGAANVSADQVEHLSMSISNNTGISRLAIESGARMLLTFTNIRNEVGKGNDIFNQSVKAVNNVAAAMAGSSGGSSGDSIRSASIQLGKALNDPIRGMTALTRVGVTFNDQQRAQITAMVKSGNLLGAQKIILAELSKEFGGAAKASTTMGQKLSTAFENVRESIGKALLPVIDAAERGIVETLLPALSRGADAMGRFFGALRGNSTISGAFRDIGSAVVEIGRSIANTVQALGPFARDLAKVAAEGVVIAFRGLAAVLAGVGKALQAVTGFFAHNKVAAGALAGVITASLVPAVAGMVAQLGRIVALNVGAALFVIKGAVVAAASAFVEADGAVAGFKAAMVALGLNPVVLAIAGIGAAVGVMVATLRNVGPSIESSTYSVEQFSQALTDLANGSTGAANVIRQFEDNAAGLEKAGYGFSYVASNASNLDSALAGLVTSGHADQAATGIDQIRTSLIQAGVPLSTITSMFPDYNSALASSASSARAAGTGVDSFGNAVSDTAKQTQAATTAIQAYSDALHALTDPLFAFNQALVDQKAKEQAAAAAVKKYGENSSEAHQANLALASSSINVQTTAEALRKQFNAGTISIGKLRRELTNLAADNLLTKKQADQLGQSFSGLIGKSVKLGPAIRSAGTASDDATKHIGGAQKAADQLLKQIGPKGASNIGSAALALSKSAVSNMSKGLNPAAPASAARRVVAKVIAAMKAGTGQARSAGVNFGDSYAAGIAATAAATGISAASIVTNAINAVNHAQQSHSPSKVGIKLGGWLGQGYSLGIDQSTPVVVQSAQKMTDAALKATEAGLQKQQAAVKSHLQSLRSDSQSLASSLSDSLSGGADLSNLTIDKKGKPGQSDAFLENYAQHLKTFVRDLSILRKNGLSKVLVDQIAGLGPEQGLPVVKDLLGNFGAKGVHSRIADLNKSERSILTTSRGFGQTQAKVQYGPQLTQANTHLSRISTRLDAVEKAIKALPPQIASSLNGVAAAAQHKGKSRAAK